MKIIDRLVGWWQSRCSHSGPANLHVDILEGGSDSHEICWCSRCGAYGIAYKVATKRGHETIYEVPRGTVVNLRVPRADW